MKQYGLHQDAARSLALAKKAIRAKIQNGLEVIERWESRDTASDVTAEHRRQMRDALGNLDGTSTVEAVDGVEGAAARAYFDGLMRFNQSPFPWQGRSRHPPQDEVNALLSLTYTLLMNEIRGLLESAGLDSYLGFLHQPDYGRPSLALDVLEPFRHPVADRFVLTCLNRQVFGREDFERKDGQAGVYLSHRALKQYFASYERWMLAKIGTLNFRMALQEEVRRFARAVREDADYAPFRWPLEAAACST